MLSGILTATRGKGGGGGGGGQVPSREDQGKHIQQPERCTRTVSEPQKVQSALLTAQAAPAHLMERTGCIKVSDSALDPLACSCPPHRNAPANDFLACTSARPEGHVHGRAWTALDYFAFAPCDCLCSIAFPVELLQTQPKLTWHQRACCLQPLRHGCLCSPQPARHPIKPGYYMTCYNDGGAGATLCPPCAWRRLCC